MDKVISTLEELKEINNRYDISNAGISRLQEEMQKAKVCTPVIGKFSSGKSALLNTVLGYNRKILKENITPETAVPTEITYTDSEDIVTIIGNDGEYRVMSVEEYRHYEVDSDTIKNVQIQLRNSFLEEIPDIMLVDMPGFESGYDVHNKAIDNYLPQSLAYIITFPADDMIIRSSVGNILKELCLHDMPLCVVITKYDKKNDDFQITFEKLKENLKKIVGEREIYYCTTSSFRGDAEQLEEFLKEVQERSRKILAIKYRKIVLSMVDQVHNYLTATLNGSQLSESELDEQKDTLNRKLSNLESKFSKEQQSFEQQMTECIQEMKADVLHAMEDEEPTLVTMILNNQDIKEHLTVIIRKAVTISVKERYIPRVEKYLENAAKTIKSESMGDVDVMFQPDMFKMNKITVGRMAAVVTGSILSCILSIGFPVLGILAMLVIGVIDKKKQREEAKKEISKQLRTEVFPQVLQDVENNIEMVIMEQSGMINDSIEEEIANQKKMLEKTISDLKEQMSSEKDKKDKFITNIKADLEKVEGIKDELR